MKILIVQDYLRSGGTERQSVFLGAAFARAGHEVTLLTFRPRGALAEDAEQLPFAFRSLQPVDCHADWFAPGLLSAAEDAMPSVVLCMGRMANCYAGFIQRRLPQAAVIATMRTGKALPFLFRRSLFRCRHVVANSLEARRVLIDSYGLPPEKITVIRNPLLRPSTAVGERNYELRRQHGAEARTQVLLNVAMFRREKNQRELIQICSRLPGYLDWQLWLAGDGPSRAACERYAVDLGLASRVRFLGYQTDPSPLYLAADVAVLTSQSESLSNFLIEAQFDGLPAVAYDIVGVGECFVPDESGFLVPNRNQDRFADCLVRLLREPALRRRFAAAAREHARTEFVPEHQVQAHLALFIKILARSV